MFRRIFFALIVLGVATPGCKASGPEWHVVTQAHPNPMSPHTQFHLESVSFEGARIDESPVDDLASLPPAERSQWLYSLSELQKTFAGSFLAHRGEVAISQGPVGPNDLVIRTRIERISTAKISADEDATTVVAAHVEITNASGAVLDDIAIDKTVVAAEAKGPDELSERRPERLRKAGAAIGAITAEYLRGRLHD